MSVASSDSSRTSVSSARAAAPAAVVTPPASVPAAPTTRGGKGRLVTLALLLTLVVAPSTWWWLHRGLESTDDAQLDADVVAVPSRAGGTVTHLHFKDNQRVEAGALLVELDDAVAKVRLAQAEAELAAARATADAERASAELTQKNAAAGSRIAQASLSGAAASVNFSSDQSAEVNANLAAQVALRDKAALDLKRSQGLVSSGAVSPADLDAARTNLEATQAAVDLASARVITLRSSTSQARAKASEAAVRLGQANETRDPQVAEAQARANSASARVATAEAARDLAKVDLSYTKIFAPRAGVLSRRSVVEGQLLTAGQSVVMVVPDRGEVWVTGNFKETQLSQMRIGQSAEVALDAYGRKLRGHVESFSGATGSRFALLPPDNATGNYTKVVQRVPVRIRLDETPSDLMLLPGLSVELTVDTR